MIDCEWSHAIPLEPDDVFKALSNSRRRQVILSLARTEESVSASTLAVEIAEIENTDDTSRIMDEQLTRIYIDLTQVHLGMLDDLEVAQYDDRSKQVNATEATKPLAGHLRRILCACYTPTEDSAEP